MSAIAAIQSYGNIFGGALALPQRSAATAAAANPTGDGGGGSRVSISAAARAAAKSDTDTRAGMPLPDDVRGWFAKNFPPDILDEAKARLKDIQANGELGAQGPLNLPLLPENQALLDGFRSEMHELSAAGHANMNAEQSARFNLLMNLSMRLQLTGWQQPMTETDVQREFDIANAMAKLAHDDPSLRPPEPPAQKPEDSVAEVESGALPSVWRTRWENAGLTMPHEVSLAPERSMWLDLAEAAGIGADEFMAQLREMAGDLKGQALTRAMESFISTRYLAQLEANSA